MKIIVKTLFGAEELLARELSRLGAVNINAMRRALTCEADLRTLYDINLRSRMALRVLVPVVECCDAQTDEDLYAAVYDFPWEDMIDPQKTIMIDHMSFSSTFPNSQFLAYRTKDAIVDRIRDKTGLRPSVDTQQPDILLNVHATDDDICVSLDASGASLNKRGYRSQVLPTATNEVLAAALVEMSGWTEGDTLIDPMCGSGTVCIEAAMMARHIAPGILRGDAFGFTQWLNYDAAMWHELREAARSEETKVRLNIIGSDVDTEALDVAKLATLDMGLSPDVRIVRRPLREAQRTTSEGIVITCPPQSEEETRRNLPDLYKEVAYYLSHNYPDHDAWLYSTNLKALRNIGYRTQEKYRIYNGSKEGEFCMYPF